MKRLCIALLLIASNAVAAEYWANVGTAAVKVAGAASSRSSLCVKSQKANTGKVYCQHNNSAVTTGSGGMEINSVEGYCWNLGSTVQDPLWCVSDTASQILSVEDAYR